MTVIPPTGFISASAKAKLKIRRFYCSRHSSTGDSALTVGIIQNTKSGSYKIQSWDNTKYKGGKTKYKVGTTQDTKLGSGLKMDSEKKETFGGEEEEVVDANNSMIDIMAIIILWGNGEIHPNISMHKFNDTTTKHLK